MIKYGSFTAAQRKRSVLRLKIRTISLPLSDIPCKLVSSRIQLDYHSSLILWFETMSYVFISHKNNQIMDQSECCDFQWQ